MIENWCNVNGDLIPEAEATIPVLDRGFLFGDSVYEVLRTRCGVPFVWREHLDRMRTSASALSLEVDLDDREIMRRVLETIQRAGATEDDDVYVRIVVTRGTGSAPNIDLSFAPGPATTVLIVRPLPKVAGLPSRLALIPRLRNDRRALDPAIKSGNYLNNVLGLAEAKAAGATDCLFMNADGNATEASTANFYVVDDGAIWTPPLEAGLLPGITRMLLRECAENAGIGFGERDLSEADIGRSNEMFLSSTARDISPVTHVNGRELNGGEAGPFTAEMMGRFTQFCRTRALEIDAGRLAELGL